jgi:hypothetical protein
VQQAAAGGGLRRGPVQGVAGVPLADRHDDRPTLFAAVHGVTRRKPRGQASGAG